MADDKSKDVILSSSVSEESGQVAADPKVSRKSNGRRRFVLIVLVLAAIVFYWQGLRNVALKVTPAMSGLEHPSVNASGRVDYFKALEALYPQEMKTNDNVARRLVAQFGSDPFAKLFEAHPGFKQYFYEQLGLDANIKPSAVWPDLDKAVASWLEKKYPGADGNQLFKRNARWALFQDASADTLSDDELAVWNKDCEQFCQDWFKKNESEITGLMKLLQGNVFCLPCIPPGDKDLLPTLLSERHKCQNQLVNNLAKLISRWVAYKCKQGDFTSALAGVSVLRQFAQTILVSEPRFTQTDLAALAVDKSALIFDFNLGDKFRPDKEFWTKYNDVITKFMYEDDRERSVDNTLQFNVYPLMEALSQDRSVAESFDIQMSSWLGYDWSMVAMTLTHYRTHVDELIKIENKSVNFPEKTRVIRRAKSLSSGSRSALLAWDICHAVVSRFEAFYEAGHTNRCLENVRRITMAMELYRCEHKTYPPAFTVDNAGKPLQSWRVLLLPYLGEKEKALYAKIKLQEPWNSEYNKQFHEVELPVYCCPSSIKYAAKNKDSVRGRTAYAVVMGKDALFDNSGKGKPCPEAARTETESNPFPDILVAERHRSVCWMNPGHEIEEKNLFKGVNCSWSRLRMAGFPSYVPGPSKQFPACLDSLHRGVVVVGKPNGRIVFLPQTLGGAI